ncbi:Predicted ABC-type transport system, membrane protein [Desulfamplus magnetovallimortis]|uniref:Predicted ABC-type transport system, membrane protein n=1 Tax=Desulfamplus magnetovallimortis TaxID=1246637 RepID=A0A1W1HIC6_9BACT|nr:Gldg family protein [Desulfamplus magnetovallimortis]SLM32128.1 Predicted ABC-type transport system, membrane protein [Desulfamplus magnetovallimortis]
MKKGIADKNNTALIDSGKKAPRGGGNKGAWIKFLLYFAVVVLVNVAGVTLFFRADLTSNGLYSLSDASHEVVESLSEPLSIKVFFTKNLPAPHNNTERYLHDLMEEYAARGGKLFNYRFYDVTAGEAGMTEQTNVNRQMAEDYGISPVQIRIIENDEVKFQQAYMGLVIIHGDMMEKIPAITSTNGLEYTLTTAIQKLNNKVSALMALDEKVKITLYLSSSLEKVAPLMGLDQLSSLPERIEEVVEKLNTKSLGKIDYKYVDPTKENNLDEIAEKYNVMAMKWPAIPQKGIEAGNGGAGIVMQYKEKIKSTPIISSINLPIIGTTYQMVDPDALDELFTETMETMIGINENIGYLADHGTLSLMGGGMGMMPGQQGGTMNVFNDLISKRYTIQDINLKDSEDGDESESGDKSSKGISNIKGDGGIPEGLKTLIIARPTEPFSDYELFLIDQALMKGTNIAFFTDTFNEIMSQQQMGFGGGPQYIPIDTGLDKLLNHYGVKIDKSYILDKNCYKQMKPARQGGGEQEIYFAPIIKDANINNSPDFMKNIKGIIAMKISPITLDEQKLEQSGVTATRLFSSSDESWLMKDRINLNPMFIRPPAETSEMQSHALAYMLSGEFTSYFAGKSIPQKDVAKKDSDDTKKEASPDTDIDSANTGSANESESPKIDETSKDEAAIALSEIEVDNTIITKGKPGKIFVMACSSMLQDNMLDPEGRTTNATFILNVIDHLNDQDDIAEMRSKNQTLNPLSETTPFARGFIKTFNIAGLPALMILFGFGVWLRRNSRRKTIKIMFHNGRDE